MLQLCSGLQEVCTLHLIAMQEKPVYGLLLVHLLVASATLKAYSFVSCVFQFCSFII